MKRQRGRIGRWSRHFVSRARSDEAEISPEEHQEISLPKAQPPIPASKPAMKLIAEPAPASDVTPILSLNSSNPASVLDAVLQHHRNDLIACPVPLPMCEVGRLAVGRDRQLLLLAVAGKGLADLRSIGYAYRWLTENRQLVAMAMPQLAIDANSLPKLRLLVDHADRQTADALADPAESSGGNSAIPHAELVGTTGPNA